MASGTIQREFSGSRTQLCSWGTYGNVGDKITLNQSFRNFPYIMILVGWDNVGEGVTFHFFPTAWLTDGYQIQVHSVSAQNGTPRYVVLKVNSATELEVTASNTSGYALGSPRYIYGIN